MRCDEVRDRLFDVTHAALTPSGAAVGDHLRHCADCRDRADRAAHVWRLLGDLPDPQVPSTALRQHFMETLDREPVAGKEGHHVSVPASRGWRPRYQAAALILVFVGGVLLGRSTPNQSRSVDTLTATRQELRELRGLVTMTLIRQDLASERLRGVSAAAQLDTPPPDVLGALVETLRHDPDVNVRLACIRALERFRGVAVIEDGAIEALDTEDSPLVSIALIEFLASGDNAKAITVLNRLAADDTEEEDVRTAASDAAARMREGGRL